MSENSLASSLNEKFLKHESLQEELSTPIEKENFVKNYVNSIIQEPSASETVFNEKLQNKTLFLTQPNQQLKLNQITSKKLKRNQSRVNPLTGKLKREFKCFELDTKLMNYEVLLNLNQLWLQYIKDLQGNQSPQLFAEHLLKADLHVKKSKNHTLVNQSGIVIQEFKNIFKLVTPSNQLIAISKSSCVFRLTIEGCTYDLFGPQLVGRPADRSCKKFKEKPTIDL